MNHAISWIAIRAFLCLALSAGASTLVGCAPDGGGGGGGGDDEPLECCMLKEIASMCDRARASASLRQSVHEWRTVGESGNAAACERMVDDREIGCYDRVASFSYGENDALVACAVDEFREGDMAAGDDPGEPDSDASDASGDGGVGKMAERFESD